MLGWLQLKLKEIVGGERGPGKVSGSPLLAMPRASPQSKRSQRVRDDEDDDDGVRAEEPINQV